MNPKLTLVTHLLIGISLGVDGVAGLRCYVCGDDEELPCKGFDISNDTYIQDCNSSANQGCVKITGVGQISRSCVDRKFNQCLPANQVEYCYCHTDLCNGNIGIFVSPTDDEDLFEGSGTLTSTEKPNVRFKVSAGVKVDLNKLLIFVSFIAFFYK
ncbi:hypothetical protein NQ314_016254 [Rhamnusium bicolor]|uniref:Protein quiver n=1 Tax=Rhamnusium bicolor TaxID=1586634 RepID=A0AAV8WXB4_9CUCU|nr:hypothetical protein NQ314_016254 [Rhamnusium bicolor]